ncbi:metal-binding protein ZinT [Macrococcus animalis]|uniref:metal-binding protein ZinT n=2 Tax=Macrococcus animalis TaxID=3395467 RepID=UPI0039BECA30
MKQSVLKGLSVLSLGVLLVGCQDANQSKENDKENKTETTSKAVEEKKAAQEHQHEQGHSHGGHEMTKEEENIYKGIFKNEQVKDRPLTDWEGDWQSVYPYLQDGTLDEVFEHKAEDDDSKTAKEYKAYYTTGYKTDISRINIGEKEISFYKGKVKATAEYEYDGKEILKYEAGNRGVRFVFKKVSGNANAPKFIQFSDHIIAPEKALHYHIYMGNDRAELLKEMEHWPTYYPADLEGEEIKEEMLAH